MSNYTPDPRSVAGKMLPVDEQTDLLVIGAGPAGLAAALEGVRLGLGVVLVEEAPVAATTMGMDVPLHFGGRAGGAVRNRTAMTEAILASDPAIATAFEAGVDLRLGTSAWGLWSNNPAVGWLPGLIAGLAEERRSWLLRARRVIVAAGRRDMGLAFPGWELPGVMGASAAEQLVRRYGALDANRVVVLGTTADTVAACRVLQEGGIEIAAMVEQAAAPIDDGATRLGVPVLLRHAPRRATGGANGVHALDVGGVDAEGRPIAASERTLACDAILLGIAAVPTVELLDALGSRLVFDAARGGHVPVLDAAGQTTVAGVYAAGDCAGIWAAKTASAAIAQAEGERAARAAALSLGRAAPSPEVPDTMTPSATFDVAHYRLAWIRASVIETADTVPANEAPLVCQCESVTARDILDVRPPRYLGADDRRNAARTVRSLLNEGPPDQDQVKRLTRAGMGLCQGRRCREQVAALLALGAGVPLDEVALATYRAPVRPLPLAAAAETAEPADITAQWDTWFGMPTQYLPPWDVAPRYTAASRDRDRDGETSSE